MNRQSDKTTALYCRLANFTEMDSLTAKHQMDQLAAYAAENGLQNPEFFCDWGFSGTNTERPEYQRMLHEVEAGRVNNLVVVSLCRLGRDYMAIYELMEHTLPLHHVTLHSIKDNLPQQKPDGKMAAIYEALHTSFFKERKGGRK